MCEMSEIPEEIRRMFPNDTIQKFDIDDNGNLLLIASAEPLVNDPLIDDPFENAPIEQVNQYLREHGYVPEQVAVNVKILVDALIENVGLHARIAVLESALEAEREKTRWFSVGERLPELDDTIPIEYCWTRFTGNVQEIISCPYWCEFEVDEHVYYDMVFFVFEEQKWIRREDGIEYDVKVLRYQPMPPLPEPPKEGDIC
jgi:hypothetical protein